jgi:hypothetical protein
MSLAERMLGVLLVAASAVAASCGDDESGAPPGLVPHGFVRAERAAGGRELRLVAVDDPCHLPIKRARVEESDTRVLVTLYVRRVPPERACIQLAASSCVIVTLREPLGDRDLVDGAPRGGRREGPAPVGRLRGCRRVPVDRG